MRFSLFEPSLAFTVGCLTGQLIAIPSDSRTWLLAASLAFAMPALVYRRSAAITWSAAMAAMLVSGLAVASSVQAPGAPPAGDNKLCLIQIREGQRPVFQTADVLATVFSCRVDEDWVNVNRPVRISGIAGDTGLLAGDRMLLRVAFRQGRQAMHEFESQERLDGFTPRADALAEPILLAPVGVWTRPLDHLRQRLDLIIIGRLRGDVLGVMMAMVTGSRGALSDEMAQSFSATGIAHVIAVSGMHLILLAQMFGASVGLLLRRMRGLVATWGADRVAAALVLPMALGYVVVTGAPASAVRAGVMLAASLSGRLLDRPAAGMDALCAAIIAMLAWDPIMVFDMGFQLSVAATMALVLHGNLPDPTAAASSMPTHLPAKLRRWFVDSIRISVVASAGTTAALLYHFGSIPPLSPLANLVVVPLASVAFPLAIIGCLLDLVGLTLPATPIWWAVQWISHWSLVACESTAGFLSAQGIWGRPSIPWMLLLCAGGLLACVGRGWWAAGALSLLLMWWPVQQLRSTGFMELRAIPVGQGDCTLVTAPHGETWLIDAGGGGMDPASVGRRRVLPYLRLLGVARVDHLVVTHADSDHAGGMLPMLRALRPRDLILPANAADAPLTAALVAEATRLGIPVRLVDADYRESRNDWRVSWWVGSDDLSDNDGGLVTQFCLRDVCALLTGDAELERERRLVRTVGQGLRSTYLKVGHHGSRTSTSSDFLDLVRPLHAVMHLGRDNRFRFPHDEPMRVLQQRRVPTCRTDQGRACVFTSDGRSWWTAAFTPSIP